MQKAAQMGSLSYCIPSANDRLFDLAAYKRRQVRARWRADPQEILAATPVTRSSIAERDASGAHRHIFDGQSRCRPLFGGRAVRPCLLSIQLVRCMSRAELAYRDTVKKIASLGTTALAAVMVVGAARAADMPVKAPVYAAAFNGTGCYIGAHVGAGWSTKEWSEVGIVFANYNLNGFLGGGQIGYNWQSGWAVFGVEADASLSDIKGSFFDFGISSKIDSLGTVTARFGGAVDQIGR